MAFSSRLHWNAQPNRLSLLLARKRRASEPVLDLTESNPTHAGFSYPPEIAEAFNDPRVLVYDPAPAGSLEARAAVCAYYQESGVRIEPDRILLTASTSESYSWLFKLLANPGDDILVPRPSYPLFEFLASLESVRVVHYPLGYHDGWSIDVNELWRRVTPRTRAVVLVNPNNPTGSFVKSDELRDLVALCAGRDLAIISDEVFADYSFGPDPRRVPTLANAGDALVFCLSGLSKVAGLPQMKLGWIAVGGPSSVREQAIERLELIADTYLSVGTPVQLALPSLLRSGMRQQIAARVAANLAHLRAALGPGSAFELLKLEGGWYATVRVPRTRTEEEWCLELLEQTNVLVQPGFFFDFESEAFLILSLLTPADIFQEGARRLRCQLT